MIYPLREGVPCCARVHLDSEAPVSTLTLRPPSISGLVLLNLKRCIRFITDLIQHVTDGDRVKGHHHILITMDLHFMCCLCAFPWPVLLLPSVVWRFHSGLGLCAVHWGCVPPLALGHIFFQCPLNSQCPQTAREAGQAHAMDGEDHSCHLVLFFHCISIATVCTCTHGKLLDSSV